MFDEKWDMRFMRMAKMVSEWSKDPSTQCGAVLVDSNKRLISVGYNGFAQNVEDTSERYADRYGTKYKIVIHAEVNAVLFADSYRLQGSCLYTWPFQSCAACAGKMIQVGVKRVVSKEPEHIDLTNANDPNRWERDFVLSKEQFTESGVEMKFYPKEMFEGQFWC